MKRDRLARVNEQLKREIGSYLFRLVDEGRDGVDVGLITVTHALVSSSLRAARILVSVRGHEADRRRILSFLNGHRAAIQEHVASHMVLKYTPRLEFHLDTSLEDGDRVLSLLSRLGGEPDGGAGQEGQDDEADA